MTAAKALVALIGAALVTLVSALSDGHVNAVETVQIAISVTMAAGVWLAGNHPELVWPKTAIASVLAVLNLFVTYVAAGPITASEWANLALAFLTAIGVAVAPPTGQSTARRR
jgi:hypothetical protein